MPPAHLHPSDPAGHGPTYDGACIPKKPGGESRPRICIPQVHPGHDPTYDGAYIPKKSGGKVSPRICVPKGQPVTIPPMMEHAFRRNPAAKAARAFASRRDSKKLARPVGGRLLRSHSPRDKQRQNNKSLLKQVMAECPGIYKLAEMQDGLLARLRIPGGILSSVQASNIAKASEDFGNGIIDLTNRANLQLRGIKPENQTALIEFLLSKKLISSSPMHDRLRNITMDPFAGLRNELIDCRIVVQELDAAILTLSNPELYSPKLAFVLDGGGETNIHATPHDFACVAIIDENEKEEKNKIKFQIHLCGQKSNILIQPDELVKTLMGYLKKLQPYAAYNSAIAEDKNKNIRLKNLLKEKGAAQVLNILAPNQKAKLLREKQNLNVPPLIAEQRLPTNLTAQIEEEKYAVNLVSPTGRLHYFQLQGLAELATTYGSAELRLTTWQGIILPDIAEGNIDQIWERSEAMALLTQENEQNLQVISCSGKEGCIYGGFETKLKALEIRDALADMAIPNPISIHLSACEKGCATTKKTNYLAMQKRGSDKLTLYVNAATNIKASGKTIKEDELVSELKKLI